MYLPPSTYAAVRDLWRSHCPWGACAARVEAGQYDRTPTQAYP